mmetsp:Transcript_55685/g.162840  ORF Transcript_55685/g.162840 Transcript_55685/m.162840 type:complete len:118 (+) Transcript_55685:103-456(+)
MSMHTTNEWHQSSSLNMTQAQQAHRRAHQQNGLSQRAHEETTSDNLGMYGEVHSSLRQKVQSSHRLIDALQRRADSLEASLQEQQASLAELEAAHTLVRRAGGAWTQLSREARGFVL